MNFLMCNFFVSILKHFVKQKFMKLDIVKERILEIKRVLQGGEWMM